MHLSSSISQKIMNSKNKKSTRKCFHATLPSALFFVSLFHSGAGRLHRLADGPSRVEGPQGAEALPRPGRGKGIVHRRPDAGKAFHRRRERPSQGLDQVFLLHRPGRGRGDDQKLLGQGRQLRHHAGDVFVGQKAHQQPQLRLPQLCFCLVIA